jgi:hypothetical protein
MIRVNKLIEELKRFPPDSLAYAYEGESCCVVVVDHDGKQLGYIPAYEGKRDDAGKTVIEKVPR